MAASRAFSWTAPDVVYGIRWLGVPTGDELLARNEYLAAENRILKAELEGRLKLSDAERATLREGSTIAAVCSRCQSQRFRASVGERPTN